MSKLVPREPTPSMSDAGDDAAEAFRRKDRFDTPTDAIWRAMYDATPNSELDALDALKAIVDFCDDPRGSESSESLAMGLCRLLPTARAALAKATGAQ